MSDLYPFSTPATVAFVAFSDAPSMRFLRFLKPGFRHCFLLIPLPSGWLTIDPLCSGIEIMTHDAPTDHRFIDLFINGNLNIVSKRINTVNKKILLPLCFSCVGLVKRVLGVRAWWVQTPYQLYRYLQNQADEVRPSDPFYELSNFYNTRSL